MANNKKEMLSRQKMESPRFHANKNTSFREDLLLSLQLELVLFTLFGNPFTECLVFGVVLGNTL